METKQDIQLSLLQEIDEICSKNNLDYILIGKNGLNAFLNHTIKDASQTTAIAMPRGDIDRFYDIIEEKFSKDRYVEKFTGRYNLLHLTYGNRNTTDLNMLNVNSQVHHGIQIKIFPIYQVRTKKGKRISYEDFQNKVTDIKYSKNKLIKKIYNQFDVTEERYAIDRWIHIQNFSKVRIINSIFDSAIFSDIIKTDVDGIKLSILKNSDDFFYKIYGRNYKYKKIKAASVNDKRIIITDKPYEDILNEIGDILIEINALNDEVKESVLKVKNDKPASIKIWKLARMTDDEIRFTEYFKDKIDYLSALDLNDEKQFDEVYKELTPAINALKKYSKFGMTFSIDEKTDSLIEKVLLMENNKKLVGRIKKLSQKQYFVE